MSENMEQIVNAEKEKPPKGNENVRRLLKFGLMSGKVSKSIKMCELVAVIIR